MKNVPCFNKTKHCVTCTYSINHLYTRVYIYIYIYDYVLFIYVMVIEPYFRNFI